VEAGLNGRTTSFDDFYRDFENGRKGLCYNLLQSKPIDLLIIMLGTNDTKGRFGEQARGIADGAGRLVDLAQKSAFGRDNRAPAVLLVSPISIEYSDVFRGLFDHQAVEKAREFPVEFRRIAEEYGCDFLDASEYAGPCAEDGVHLDARGHEALAQAMYRAVKLILG